jgi:CheY-like chemotaxis protein
MIRPAHRAEQADPRRIARRTTHECSEAAPQSAAPSSRGGDVPPWRIFEETPGPISRRELAAGPGGETKAMSSSVLVVDDNIKIRLDLRGALHAAGFIVTACDGRASAIKALRGKSFDLVILDVILQDGTGIELVRILRSMPETASIPVILLASDSGTKERVRALDLDVSEVLQKPFITSELVRCAVRIVRAGSPSEPSPRSEPARSYRSDGRDARDEGPRSGELPPSSVGSVWRHQSEVPVGSLLFKASVQSGIAFVLGPLTVARACKRAGVDCGASSAATLEQALPAIRDTLRLFLSEGETESRIGKLASLLRSLS